MWGKGITRRCLKLPRKRWALTFEKIRMAEVSDTAFTQSSGSASASRLTFMAGNAVRTGGGTGAG
jgi:CO/xanthine dehydrogenase Mo-binding subunit